MIPSRAIAIDVPGSTTSLRGFAPRGFSRDSRITSLGFGAGCPRSGSATPSRSRMGTLRWTSVFP